MEGCRRGRTGEVSEFESALQSVRDIFVNYPKRVITNKEELVKIDNEIQDILHLIEMTSFSASDGYKYAKDLQRLRLARRKVKDDLELLAPIEEFLTFAKPTEKIINTTLGKVRSVQGLHKTRVYKMRVRTGLQEYIK
jgi:hypothetical protein